MATVEEFLRAQTEELLERCSQEELVKVIFLHFFNLFKHFKMDVCERRLKENVTNILRENQFEAVVLPSKVHVVGPELDTFDAFASSEAGVSSGLIFKRLLLLQLEIKGLELEESRLSLGDVGGVGQVSVVSPGLSTSSYVTRNLRMVPVRFMCPSRLQC